MIISEDEILPGGMAWFKKALTPLMLQFEKETGSHAIWKDKVTWAFSKWQRKKWKEFNHKKTLHYRTIYQKETGKKLTPKDIIHHIDLDKSNDDITNLYKTTNDNHSLLHKQVNKIGKILFKIAFKQGLITFNNFYGKYILDKNVDIIYNKEKV